MANIDESTLAAAAAESGWGPWNEIPEQSERRRLRDFAVRVIVMQRERDGAVAVPAEPQDAPDYEAAELWATDGKTRLDTIEWWRRAARHCYRQGLRARLTDIEGALYRAFRVGHSRHDDPSVDCDAAAADANRIVGVGKPVDTLTWRNALIKAGYRQGLRALAGKGGQ